MSDDKIIDIHSRTPLPDAKPGEDPLPPRHPIDAALVANLEQALKDAKEGRIRGVFLIGVASTEQFFTVCNVRDEDLHSLLGRVSRFHLQIMQHINDTQERLTR